jgi:hypothetical protein
MAADDDGDNRLAIYGIDTSEAREGLRRLACARHVVLDEEDRIVMAHPFAAIQLGFSVMCTSTSDARRLL